MLMITFFFKSDHNPEVVKPVINCDPPVTSHWFDDN